MVDVRHDCFKNESEAIGFRVWSFTISFRINWYWCHKNTMGHWDSCSSKVSIFVSVILEIFSPIVCVYRNFRDCFDFYLINPQSGSYTINAKTMSNRPYIKPASKDLSGFLFHDYLIFNEVLITPNFKLRPTLVCRDEPATYVFRHKKTRFLVPFWFAETP